MSLNFGHLLSVNQSVTRMDARDVDCVRMVEGSMQTRLMTRDGRAGHDFATRSTVTVENMKRMRALGWPMSDAEKRSLG